MALPLHARAPFFPPIHVNYKFALPRVNKGKDECMWIKRGVFKSFPFFSRQIAHRKTLATICAYTFSYP